MWKIRVQLPALPDSGQGFFILLQGFEHASPTYSPAPWSAGSGVFPLHLLSLTMKWDSSVQML